MEIGTVQPVDIDEQMRTAYLDYAMSVIVARALPDARDGLKPVHRRILYAMQELGIHHNSPYKKSARIVGEVLGKYHPHGDVAVYDAMARLSQDFSMRYPLVDGQGNFGSIDGDAPAAMRYTEARLAALAGEMLQDIDKNTVDFLDNFDGSLQEPSVLPARLPNLLLNGSSGIAVGMATNIPPHNLREIAAAANHLIDNYDHMDDISIDDLMQFIPGPDFPTGGIIVGRESIRQAYTTGRGRLTVRAMAHIEEIKGGRYSIVITEIPFQVNKTGLIERIADLAREGRLDTISDLRDESDRRGMSIVIELKRGAQPRQVLNQLYKFTPLQTTFSFHMLALVENEPRVLSLKRALQIYIEHRQVVIARRSQFELDKARARAHILDGLLIALAHLDDVIQTIRQSPDADTARERLITRFKLTEVQAQAILDMQLRRLAALERQKIEDEHRDLMSRIAYLEELLANPGKILQVIKSDLEDLAQKYGDERRTRLTAEPLEEIREEDLVPDEPILITFTQRGYIKRVAANLYRTQSRGGRGVTGQTVKEEDEILMLIPARTLDTILFFSDQGKVYSEKAYQLPDAGRTSTGIPIVNILSLNAGERITAAVPVPNFEAAEYCTMLTLHGRMKRISLSEFASVRPSGLIAISLDDHDELGWVRLTSGKDDLLLVTAQGQALRISEEDIRPMGRQAGGVTGINLRSGDVLASLEVVQPDGSLFIVTENGYGKRVDLVEYPQKGRATGGVVTIDQKNINKTGKIVAARVVQESDEVTMISTAGIVLRLKVKEIGMLGRGTRGVRLMDLSKTDTVASVARIPATGNGN
ncbi:MAG TPA: DNA gyrase subunit A [Anaerolineaceae bacterium]|nr:DNA gyrase subunit A [Anaerolineaceae bacterium]HOU43940.1 DNA gyrase subunit A [Anaerolineaceae bacterium]HQF45002.1 DNA gyrase subunit A [Anaerolineaceae bacterium]HQH35119.1 DNA gyrase subunit A [Anaerolineaceae bacterium]HQJ03412.1 DNA gyrase subunit A [Anaerolineaceae bacterium]